ncbi:MAG: hypothetical protein J6J97_00865 [Akkermansia sp.]|nr:hypothetical protein [Akkermansia sp.]
MPSSAIVKNVLTCFILLVLCIVVGAQAAEDRTISVGIIAALVGGGGMLWLGPRCWVLIFLFPPVISLLPMPGKLAVIPVPFLIGLVVLGYWIVMWGMGYVKFKWRGLLILDLTILLLAAYMALSYYRHPVSMAVLGYETEFVGGKEYVYCLLGCLFYIAISSIPCSYEQILPVMKWAVRLSVVGCLVGIGLGLSGYLRGYGDFEEDFSGSRFGMFLQLGMYGIYVLYGMHPMSRVLLSPFRLIGCGLSCFAILLSGWREQMMAAGCITIVLSFIKRELWCLMLVLLSIYASLIYLSKEDVVQQLPFGVQRSISILPGVKVSDEVESDASHSSDWRIVMWKWALDPRTGYIKDYVWGDGFGISTDFLRRETTASMRNAYNYEVREQFAVTGMWHNGAITAVHRLGYVGLGIIAWVYALGLALLVRVCRALRGNPLYLPSLFLILPYAGQPSLFFISAGTIVNFFNTFVTLAMIKFFYCVAREQGLLTPLFVRRQYVPLAIRSHEQSMQSGTF